MSKLEEQITSMHDLKAQEHFHKLRRLIEEGAPEFADDLTWIADKYESMTRTNRGMTSTINNLKRSLYGKKYRGGD